MLYFTLTTLCAALAAASPIVEFVERADRPAPNEVFIAGVTARGSGCPAGSFSSTLGENGTVVSLIYEKFIAQHSNKTMPSDERKNCIVSLSLNVPAGWSYTSTTTILRGAAKLPIGCSGTLGNRFYFTGRSEEARSTKRFDGPQEVDYVQTTPVDAIIWSTCAAANRQGPIFNVNSDARVSCDNKDKEAWMTVDSQDNKFELKFLLQWRRC